MKREMAVLSLSGIQIQRTTSCYRMKESFKVQSHKYFISEMESDKCKTFNIKNESYTIKFA